MDDLKKLAKAFVDAASIAGPTSYIPEVQAYSKAGAAEGAVKQGISAGGTLSAQRGAEADAADKAARDAKIQDLANKLDPSKYQKIRKSDGGFDFKDPNGNNIDVNTYAKITGQRVVDVLKDSENPVDQEYVNDWSNMNTLMQAMYNGDTDTVNSFISQNPQLKGETPQDLMNELIRKYPHLYNVGSYGQTLQNRNNNAFSYNPNALTTGTISTGQSSASGSAAGWQPS